MAPSKNPKGPEAGGGMATVENKRDFYRDGYSRWSKIGLNTSTALILALTIIFVLVLRGPVIQNFAVTSDGRMIPLTPLDRPLDSGEIVTDFANKVAQALYRYDFHNYREQINDMEQYFTPDGYQNYLDALERSKIIAMIKETSSISTATATAAPSIFSRGEKNGVYQWVVQVPVTVTMIPANRSQSLMITLKIIRESQALKPRGLAVAAYTVDMAPRK